MKVVLDTNVLVAGLLSPYRAPAEIVRMASMGALDLCHDPRILAEYREVLLRPKFRFHAADVEDLLEALRAGGTAVTSAPLGFSLEDPDDEPFLEAAIAGQAKYLITGNIKHCAAHKKAEPKIISPADFLKSYHL